MNKNGPWIIVVILLVVVALLATGTVSMSCDSNEVDIPEAIEEAGDNIEDAAEELTDG